MRKLTLLILLGVLTGLGLACQPVRHEDKSSQPYAEPLVWPQSAVRPRIRYVQSIARPSDVGIRRSFLARMMNAILGEEELSFVRPGGVAARGDVLFVADPGARALWIINASKNQFKGVQKAGAQQLVSPVAVAPGPDSGVFLADSYLAKILLYDAQGELLDSIVHEQLQRPAGVAYDVTAARLYVADSGAHRIWVFDRDGRLVGAIGERGADRGQFNFPTHVTVGPQGTLHVTDALGFRIQAFDRGGRFLYAFGHHGNASGDLAAAKGVAVDSEGHIYVVDALFDTVQIFDATGTYLMRFGERGTAAGQFWLPGGLYINGQNRIYVADAYNQRIQVFEYLASSDDG